MANEEHIKLLRQGYKVWNEWRQQNPEMIPELKAADLRGLKLFKVDLSGVDLSEADFSETSLYKANLSSANLYKANLSTAILQEANLSEANLIEANLTDKNFFKTNISGTNLSRANLSGAKFYTSTNLSNTNFSLSNLSEADLSELDLRGNNLTGANLNRANLNATNLSGVNLCKANLSHASLEYTNLRQAQIQEAIINEKWKLIWDIINNGAKKRYLQELDLSMADLEGANFSEADLHDVNFTGTKLNRADFSWTDLSRANFREASLAGANFNWAELSEADLSGVNLSEANLKYAKLHRTQIQEAILDEKWYLVWEIINNGAEGRDLSEADLSEASLSKASLSKANFKNGNLSRVNFSGSILNGADFSWTDLSRANFRETSLAGANFNWADLSEADLSGVLYFSVRCTGASFSGTIFHGTWINSYWLNQSGASFNEADLSKAYFDLSEPAALRSVRNRKEFFENLLSWKNEEAFNESLKQSLSSSEKGFIPGVLLYTDEDDKLSLYVREHFDALDKLTGDWCNIYLLENPSPKWRKANQNWRKTIEASLHANWFRSKPYDKSEAYDIARQLDVELSDFPCLVLISPADLSEKLVIQIREVSPDYFRKLFSTLEKLVKGISSEKLRQEEARSQVFDYLKLNFNDVVNFLEKYVSKDENNSKKYILEGDNIFISIEPVNIVQGDYTDQSRNFTVGNVAGDFKPIGSALMADNFRASGTVADSINFEQGMTKEAELQNRQDEKSSKPPKL